jgi:Ca-activated chloride channel family protein
MKKILLSLTFILLGFILISCSGDLKNNVGGDGYYNYENDNSILDGAEIEGSDEHQLIVENGFIKTEVNNKSNISLSANTASYSFIRQNINNGQVVDKNAVRTEEMVNFFDYNYNEPIGDNIFGMTSQIIKTPWNNDTHLLLVGLQSKKEELGVIPTNLVILLDVSGSMASANKLPLVKESIMLLVEQMKESDIISLVTYSSGEKVVFKGKSLADFTEIDSAIKNLKASGSTAGQKGLEMAYTIAEEYFIEEGNNRIVIATDGDFNVGISDTNTLVEYISGKRETGIYFSAFGFGMGNYKDEKLERLSAAGNGSYYYIDDMLSARKAFLDGIDGLLYTVARDAKAQIIFNSETVLEYRLIGYENRQLTDEEYEDNTTDAGEIGTGLQVTAIYELKLAEEAGNFGNLSIRYKANNLLDETNYEDNFELLESIKTNTPSLDSNFIASVIEFSLILRNSSFKGDANLDRLLERIENEDNDYYRKDFIEVVKKYQLIVK